MKKTGVMQINRDFFRNFLLCIGTFSVISAPYIGTFSDFLQQAVKI